MWGDIFSTLKTYAGLSSGLDVFGHRIWSLYLIIASTQLMALLK